MPRTINKQNLKPIQKGELSKDEAKRRGSKGGKKSVEVRREKKSLKESLKILLEMVDKSGMSNQEKMIKSLYEQAIVGNVKAFEVIRDTIGEKPIDKLEQTTLTPQKIFITKEITNQTDNVIDEFIN